MRLPVVTFTAYSDSGKTTCLEKLIPCLREAGLRVAVIKHDGHDFQADSEGKDSWRFARAGAEVVAVASKQKAAIFQYRPTPLDELLSQIRDVDVILTEGYKSGPHPKVAIFRAEDIAGASPDTPVTLQVVDKLYAGSVANVPVNPGQAVRLMTGSMIPLGADCVIMQESTDEGETEVRVYKSIPAGRNICWKGEEYQQGELLLPDGQRIDAAAIAVAAGAGCRTLTVRRQVKAVILSTGDELQQPGEDLYPGKVYDSNAAYLQACLQQMGAEILEVRSVKDDTGRIAAAIDQYTGAADLILTTGGVSVGQKDLMERAVLQSGGEMLFHGLAMKPGMPTMLSVKEGTLILSLSGNPFSAAVPFFLLVRPMLARMAQNPAWEPRWITARAATPFDKRSPSRRFLRGTCLAEEVAIPQKQANGQMRSMIGCNCLLDIPAGSGPVRVGDLLKVLLL